MGTPQQLQELAELECSCRGVKNRLKLQAKLKLLFARQDPDGAGTLLTDLAITLGAVEKGLDTLGDLWN